MHRPRILHCFACNVWYYLIKRFDTTKGLFLSEMWLWWRQIEEGDLWPFRVGPPLSHLCLKDDKAEGSGGWLTEMWLIVLWRENFGWDQKMQEQPREFQRIGYWEGCKKPGKSVVFPNFTSLFKNTPQLWQRCLYLFQKHSLCRMWPVGDMYEKGPMKITVFGRRLLDRATHS